MRSCLLYIQHCKRRNRSEENDDLGKYDSVFSLILMEMIKFRTRNCFNVMENRNRVPSFDGILIFEFEVGYKRSSCNEIQIDGNTRVIAVLRVRKENRGNSFPGNVSRIRVL